jgi:hypothetical protein
MADGKRAADRLPSAKGRRATLSGTHGEAFRGYTYCGLDRDALRTTSAETARDLLVDRWVRLLPWTEARLTDGLIARVEDSVRQAAERSRLLGDLLDYVNLRERSRFRGAVGLSWLEPVHAPFESPQVTRLAYTLPAPIGDEMALHKTILRRYAPKSLWLPVNHKYVLPLAAYADPRSWGFSARISARALSLVTRLVDSVRAERSGGSPVTHDAVRRQVLLRTVSGPLRDWFTEEGSVSRRLLQRHFIQNLLGGRISPEPADMRTIGYLATLEQWRKLVHETYVEAREYVHRSRSTDE